jgi:hypothetical protein
MAAAEDDADAAPTLKRTCHVCEEAVHSQVWYARTSEADDAPRREYVCPDCFFDLDDEDREGYYRERV